MKLYYYDHCPFCVRALMSAHYKQVSIEKVILLYNDEETCIRLVGAKQVPILEFDDGTAMPESLDIAKKFDEIGSVDKTIYPQTEIKQIITDHIAAAQPSITDLLYPRNVKVGLAEFATPQAITYFQNKKEKSIKKTFDEAFAETATHKKNVETMLQALPSLPHTPDGTMSWDDIFIFPTLRNLTVVKDLIIPQTIKTYLERMSSISGVSLYYDKAL